MTKQFNINQTIQLAVLKKSPFLTVQVDEEHTTFELCNYVGMYDQLAEQCLAIIGDSIYELTDDTCCPPEMVIRFNSNKTNNEGVLNMNKTELRQELKKYGVKLTPAEFKESSIPVLEAMVAAEKLKVDMVTMEQPQQLPIAVPVMSLDDLMANVSANLDVTKLVGAQVKKSEANVRNHVTQSSQEVISALTKKIDELSATVVGLVNGQATTVKYADVTNPNQTNSQYNKKAAELKPIGQVRNDKTGQMENYFGVCSVCGCKIKSAKVVEFSMQRFGKVVCYAHQGQQQVAPKNNSSVTHKCMYCGKDVHFKDVTTFNKLSAYAKSQGLAPCAHISCWKAAKATINNVNEYMASQEELIDHEETPAPITQPSEVLIPEGNIWMQAPINNDSNNNEAY